MKFEHGDVRTFSFAEWLRTSLGSQDYDYLMVSSSEGDLYFILKNESDSRLIRVDKKTQEEITTEDIEVLIRQGQELKQPHSIEMGLGHSILFEDGKMVVF